LSAWSVEDDTSTLRASQMANANSAPNLSSRSLIANIGRDAAHKATTMLAKTYRRIVQLGLRVHPVRRADRGLRGRFARRSA
jgi:hypothetical protein